MSYDLRITAAQGVNQDLLTQQLNTALPSRCFGISTYPGNVISVWLADDHTVAEDTTAQSIVANHVPSQQTAAQAAAAASDAIIAPQQAAIATEIARLEALTAAAMSTNALAVAEIVKQGKDLAFLARLLQRRGLL